MTSRNTRRSVPPTAQHPSTAAGKTSRGQSSGTYVGTAYSGTRTTATGQTQRSQQRTRTGETKPLSLFDAANRLKDKRDEDGGGGDVKADDIWNKFVSDDNDVVRAPTAESEGSEITDIEGTLGSQGSQRLSQIGEDDEDDEEEEEEEESSDDDRTIYSDYYMAPGYDIPMGTPEIRVEITDSHEACSCFPDRSSRFIGSMLYDKVQCVHTGLVGETQAGVYKFNPYWNETMENPRRMRKRDLRVSKSKFVFGYPRPRFEIVSESEDEEDEDEDESGDDDDEDATEDGSKGQTPKTARTRATQRGYDDDDDDDDDDEDDEDEEYDSEYDSEYDDDEDDEDDEDYIPFELPQIGYPRTPSLPPSSVQSRRSVYSEYTESIPELPPIPGSRQLTARTGVTQRTQRTQQTQRQPTQRSTRTAKTAKTAKTEKSGKATAKSSKKAKSVSGSVDSGYDGGRSTRTLASRQSLPTGPVISTVRTFQGKYYDPVTKQIMLYDLASDSGGRLPIGNIEPLHKPPTAPPPDAKSKPPQKTEPDPKPGSKASQRSKGSNQDGVGLRAAVLGNVFIQNLLSKNKQNKETVEAKFSDEED